VCAFNFSVGISKKCGKAAKRENCENVEKACKMQPLDTVTTWTCESEYTSVRVVSLCVFVVSSSFIIFASVVVVVLMLCN